MTTPPEPTQTPEEDRPPSAARVVLQAFLIASLVPLTLGISTGAGLLVVPLCVMTWLGPFAGLIRSTGSGVPLMLGWGLVLGAAIAAYPAQPNRFSMWVTRIGVFLWVCMGFGATVR